jgi:uncharacterized protein (TIGR03083 family)
VDVAVHIDALRQEGARLAVATEAAGPDAGVPTCPDWAVRDLVRHTGGIHRWATGYVADRRTELWKIELEEVVGAWPEDADLADWLRSGCSVLADVLAAAPDDLECWSFLPAPSPRAMWARRQAHETAIHRIDAELAAGAPGTSVDPAFAADGVDELLVGFVPRRSKSLRTDHPASLAVHCTDPAVAATWVVHLGPDGATTAAAGSSQPTADCTVRGAAADLYLTLWNRAGPAELEVEGDAAVLGRFLDSFHVR